ncbi:unnamed protein product [Adineta ricciae]|uniref:Uncharacterized protein n=1 Tax=Adineta ricciae TaxID=249248 RepID=A0A813S7K3_ADIRI|nr:unnamed protein product [Adineta ricciae]
MYTQIFKNILLETKHDKRAITDLAKYCHGSFQDNIGEKMVTDEFERDSRWTRLFGSIHIQLQLTAVDGPSLRMLTERIKDEIGSGTRLKHLSKLLLTLGQLEKAKELYAVLLLKQTFDENDKAHYYHQLGCREVTQNDYQMTIEYYEKAVEIKEKSHPPNHPNLATSYNNIKDYSKALTYFERAPDTWQRTLPTNLPHIEHVKQSIESCKSEMEKQKSTVPFLY